MTNPLVRFVVPADFVLERVLPTSAELRDGYAGQWLDSRGLIQLEVARYMMGVSLSDAEERIALLLSDRLYELPDLVAELPTVRHEPDGSMEVWLYVALAWVIEGPTEFLDRQGTIDMLYGDFDYPTEVAPLVSYMPGPPDSDPAGSAIEVRWADYLDRKRAEYALRTAEMMGTGQAGSDVLSGPN